MRYQIDLKLKDADAQVACIGFTQAQSGYYNRIPLFDIHKDKATNGGIRLAYGSFSNFGKRNLNEWFTLVYEIDHANNTVSAQAFDADGNLMGQLLDQAISLSDSYTLTGDSYGFYISTVGNVSFDNAIITRQEYKMTNALATNPVHVNDFESGNVYNSAYHGTNVTVEQDPDDAENNVLNFTVEQEGEPSSATLNVDYAFQPGTNYVMECDVLPAHDAITGVSLRGARDQGGVAYDYSTVTFAADTRTSDNTPDYKFYAGFHGAMGCFTGESRTTEVPYDTWFHVKTTFNTDTRRVNVVVTNKATGEEVARNGGTYAYMPTGYAIVIWRDSNAQGEGRTTKVDNLKMYVAPVDTPTLSVNKIKFAVGANDVNYIDGMSAVSVDANAIKFDFGTQMMPTSINANTVKLYDSQGSSLAYTGSLDGNVYTMTLPSLNVESTYTIYISKDVLAVDGEKLGQAYMTEFRTTYGSIEITDFTVLSGNVIDSYYDYGYVEANVTYNNKSGADQQMTFYKAYYDAEGVLLDVETQNIDIAKDASETKTVQLTLKDDETFMTETLLGGQLKIFLWDSENKAMTAVKVVAYE